MIQANLPRRLFGGGIATALTAPWTRRTGAAAPLCVRTPGGVPMDKIYPVALDRAFRSLSRIRAAIPKFWDTGALSAGCLR